MESLIVLIWMDCSIARILSRIFPSPIKIANHWIHKVTQKPMPIHNKYSIFNKQTNSCAQIFHTHTHVPKCLCTLRHSADLFVYIFTCSLVLFSLHMHFGILDWCVCVWKRWQSERKEANNLPIETLIDTFIRYLLWVFDGISPLAVAIHDFFFPLWSVYDIQSYTI